MNAKHIFIYFKQEQQITASLVYTHSARLRSSCPLPLLEKLGELFGRHGLVHCGIHSHQHRCAFLAAPCRLHRHHRLYRLRRFYCLHRPHGPHRLHCPHSLHRRNCRDCRTPLPGGGSSACLQNRNLQAIISQTQLSTLAATAASNIAMSSNASPANDTPTSPGKHARSAPVDPNDLYGILGVASHCTQSEISKAYRTLALQLHPDKQQSSSIDPGKTAGFVKIAAACKNISVLFRNLPLSKFLRDCL